MFTVVRQQQAGTLERAGRYRATLPPEFAFRLPFLDRVRLVDLRERAMTMAVAPVDTDDGSGVGVDLDLAYRLVDPVAATYDVASYADALEQVARTALREFVGGLDRGQVFAEQAEQLRSVVAEAITTWGLEIRRIDVSRIQRAEDMLPAADGTV